MFRSQINCDWTIHDVSILNENTKSAERGKALTKLAPAFVLKTRLNYGTRIQFTGLNVQYKQIRKKYPNSVLLVCSCAGRRGWEVWGVGLNSSDNGNSGP